MAHAPGKCAIRTRQRRLTICTLLSCTGACRPASNAPAHEPDAPGGVPDQDAADAIDNMHNAELYGRVLRCNYAQPMKIKGGDKGFSHQPVWADADDWYCHISPS